MKDYGWDELKVGLSAAFEVRVEEDMMRRFLAITGDENPLHTEKAWALTHGFADRVVYGLLTASFYSRLAGTLLPGRRCLLHGLNVSFHKPVYVGDTLRVRGEVVYRNELFRQAELACTTTNQQGTKVAAGKLKVGVLESALEQIETKGRELFGPFAAGSGPGG